MSNLRHRRLYRDDNNEPENRFIEVVDDEFDIRRFRSRVPSSILTIMLLIIGVILFNTVTYINDHLPNPLLIEEDGKFIAKRAYLHLSEISTIGPKVIGSGQNEILAFRTVLDKVQAIKNNASPTNEIEIKTQVASGTFPVMYRGMEFTNVYYNVQNVMVKIGKTPQALLVNCHFDSVPTSPGASDDVLNCAVMLEVLHVLSQSSVKLPFSIIFLFNGAEEGFLLASHGFVTQHEWAKQVKVFINLESCGAGGRQILFQSGPNHPWLIEKYANVPHPHGTVVAEELFQSGLVTSDTDFRIFRDFGHLSGLDFAHYTNGFVYHTRLDNIESINNVLGVLQFSGDNLLSLIQSIIFSKEMVAPSPREGKMVYFDLFGYYFFYINSVSYMYLNYVTVIISAISILLMAKKYNNPRQILVYGVMSSIGGLVLSCIHNITVAFILDYKKLTLSWYSTLGFVVPLYFIPTLIICFAIATIRSDSQNVRHSCWDRVRSHCLSTQMVWTMLLLTLTIMKIRSSFIIQLLVMFPTVAIMLLGDRIKSKFGWAIFYILFTLPTSFYITYLTINVMRLFLPMSGRINDNKNPEILVGILSTLLAYAITSYWVPLILAVRKKEKYLLTLSILTWGSLLFVLCSSLVFPYTDKTPQRIIVSHVTREYHNLQGKVEMSDSYFWTNNLDRRGKSVLPFLSPQPTIEPFCKRFKFCGVPWPTGASFMASNRSLYTMAKPHNYTDYSHMMVVDDRKSGLRRQLYFNVTGSDHMILLISPRQNVVLNSWSFGVMPSPSYDQNNMTVYFISYLHGLANPHWSFWIDLKVPDKKALHVDIGLISYYYYHEEQFSKEFNEFMAKFPSFTHITPSMSVFKYFVF